MLTTLRKTGFRAPWVQRVVQLLAVMVLVGMSALSGPATANALGFSCKEVPGPQSPNEAAPAFFDSASENKPADTAGFNGTGYGTYGWAGLSWHVYDLGCGDDITGVSLVRSKTDLGNQFLATGQSFAAAAFWLDDQANSTAEGEHTGRQGALAEFDKIVLAVSDSLRPTVYGPWIGIGLAVAGVIILYRALRGDAAAVTKQLAIGAAALAIGGLMVGAPAKAIAIGDDTFNSLITKTQGQIFEAAGLSDDPRLVITDEIILPDIRKGYFGSNASPENIKELWPDLRNSLAYTYDEQERISADNSAQKDIDEDKKKQYEGIVEELDGKGLSYSTFQGKESSRVSIGLMSMIKTSMPSILWIGASILKISALLALRLAIITAPVWIPVAIVSGSTLARVGRILGGIYLWAVAAAVLMSVYLMFLINLYRNEAVDGTWRLWFLVILTMVFWMVLRPFKRLSQTVTQSSHGAIGGMMDRHKNGSWKQKLLTASSMVANPAMGLAEHALEVGRKGISAGPDRVGKAAGRGWSDLMPKPIIRQEGRALSAARTDDYRDRARMAKLAALRSEDRVFVSGAMDGLRNSSVYKSGNRLPGIDLATGRSDGGRQGQMMDLRKHESGTGFTDGFDSHNTGDGEVFAPRQEPNRWDGGPGAVIAPTTVYRPSDDDRSSDSSGSSQRPWVQINRPAPESHSTRPSGSGLPHAGIREGSPAPSTAALERLNRHLGVR